MSPTLRRSGLQKEVLALYRRPKFSLFVRYTFRTNASNISPRDVGTIEHLLRKGKRQLEMYEAPSVKDCWA
ncbi:hypothetical protein MPER_07245, partial [Moniliophthora perniciosa FA553]